MENFKFTNESPERTEKVRKKIHKTEAELQEEGYEVDIEETSDEFVVTLTEEGAEGEEVRTSHFSKKDPFPLIDEDGDLVLDYGIDDAIRAWVTSPDGNILETLREEE